MGNDVIQWKVDIGVAHVQESFKDREGDGR